MWNLRADPEVEHTIATFMRELAAEPLEKGSPVTATEIWQKAELLRRWDAQRRAVEPIDVSERVQVGIGLGGALTLVVWLARQVPQAAESPTIAAAMIASVLLIASAALFAFWSLASGD